MEFDKLREVLPKLSSCWSTSDIEIWLHFIGLQSLIPQFRLHSVDGSCLAQLTEEDLKNQLKIQSKIIIKKIMTWISQGIKCFDEELRNAKQLTATMKGRDSKQIKPSQYSRQPNEYLLPSRLGNDNQIQLEESIMKKRLSKINEQNRLIEPIKRQHTFNDMKKEEDNELIIKQCDVVQAAHYSLKGTGGMIGRHSTNQILVLDEFVSRFHAQVEFEDGQYYIMDCGSSSGTFIRITQKMELTQGMIVELGSNQFRIDLSKPDSIYLEIIEGPHIYQKYPIPRKSKGSIGRKATNQISFPQDQHLSNIHATIFEVEEVWYIEDLGTTNGTWIRLSMEGIKSQRYPLHDKTQFKLSTNLTYECRRNKNNRKTSKSKSQKCVYCGVAEKNAIFMPCKHNIGCYECAFSLNVSKCNICGSGITDLIKIFTV